MKQFKDKSKYTKYLKCTFMVRFYFLSFLFTILIFSTASAQSKTPKKVVFVAGKKSHGPGEHEYEKSLKLLKVMLDHAENIKGIKTKVYFNGWPADASTFKDADVIVVFADGSDFNEESDPLFVGDHLNVLAEQMKRGCGLVLLHYSTFAPNKYADKFLDWTGGYYDYQSGPPDSTGKSRSYSAYLVETAIVKPISPSHPISYGLKPFQIHDEFYYHIHFINNDNRFTPILAVPINGKDTDQIVAWAVTRKDGGRGFAFTGGHYFANWENFNYRKMILNAIVWASGLKVPKGGIESKYYTEDEVNHFLKEGPSN